MFLYVIACLCLVGRSYVLTFANERQDKKDCCFIFVNRLFILNNTGIKSVEGIFTMTKDIFNLEETLKDLKEACQFFIQSKNTLKDKINYYDFIIQKAMDIYIKGNKNKTGFLYVFFECKLYPVFKNYFLDNGILFASHNKGKKIHILSEEKKTLEDIKISFSEWYVERQEKERQERQEKKNSLLKKEYKTFDLTRIKTVEEIDFYILKLQQMKKTF